MVVSAVAKRWTLEELHSLPDDGNRYELIHGELFVTPAPTDEHETVASRLHGILHPYVEAHRLGYIYRPRAIIRILHGSDASEAEPDLFVRHRNPDPSGDWTKAPLPTLVVEIISPSTWRRDRQQKRAFYMEIGIPEYWIIDPQPRELTIIKPGTAAVATQGMVEWSPAGTGAPLRFQLDRLWRDPSEPYPVPANVIIR